MAIVSISASGSLQRDGSGNVAPVLGPLLGSVSNDADFAASSAWTPPDGATVFRIATDSNIYLNRSGDGAAATSSNGEFLPAGTIEYFPVPPATGDITYIAAA